MLLAYGLRGFGYPFFAYGFLVWVLAGSPAHRLDSARLGSTRLGSTRLDSTRLDSTQLGSARP
jgi:hypothetical protein